MYCFYVHTFFSGVRLHLVAVPPMVLKPQKPLNRFHLKSCTLKSISLSLHQEEKSVVYSNRTPKVNTLPRGWKSRLMLYNHNREIRICEIKSNLSQCMLCNTIEGHQCRCMPHTNWALLNAQIMEGGWKNPNSSNGPQFPLCMALQLATLPFGTPNG